MKYFLAFLILLLSLSIQANSLIISCDDDARTFAPQFSLVEANINLFEASEGTGSFTGVMSFNYLYKKKFDRGFSEASTFAKNFKGIYKRDNKTGKTILLVRRGNSEVKSIKITLNGGGDFLSDVVINNENTKRRNKKFLSNCSLDYEDEL